jgi:hypothetical protein
MKTYKEFTEDRVADAIKGRGEKVSTKTRNQQASKDIKSGQSNYKGVDISSPHGADLPNAKSDPTKSGQGGALDSDPRRFKRLPAKEMGSTRGTGKNVDTHDSISAKADMSPRERDDAKNIGYTSHGKGQNSVPHGTADAMKKSEKSDLAKKLKQPFKPKKESVEPIDELSPELVDRAAKKSASYFQPQGDPDAAPQRRQTKRLKSAAAMAATTGKSRNAARADGQDDVKGSNTVQVLSFLLQKTKAYE